MTHPRLPLATPRDDVPETLVLTPSNGAAWAALMQWRDWPGGAYALSGPAGAGKTHMARAWAQLAGGEEGSPFASSEAMRAAFTASGGRLMFDGLEEGCDDAAMSLALDLARSEGGAVLLVGRGLPGAWPATSPDLASRFNALPLAVLPEPDLDLLERVLRRLARARFIELPAPVARFMAETMERSFVAAGAAAEALDALMVRGVRPVSYEIARRALERVAAALPEDES